MDIVLKCETVGVLNGLCQFLVSLGVSFYYNADNMSVIVHSASETQYDKLRSFSKVIKGVQIDRYS